MYNIGQVPNSLPQNLIFKCAGQKTWVYVDRVCDRRNDCGDCSDESGKKWNQPVADLSSGFWEWLPFHFSYINELLETF